MQVHPKSQVSAEWDQAWGETRRSSAVMVLMDYQAYQALVAAMNAL
jgi:hypothetical protein